MVNRKASRSVRVRYIIGLSVIALALTASFFTIRKVVSEQRQFSNLVSLAAHQPGLANRIAYFCRVMVTTSDKSEFLTAQEQVGRSIKTMQSAYHFLRFGDPEKGVLPIKNDHLRELYEAPSVGLDRAVRQFLEQADTIYQSEMGSFAGGTATYPFLALNGPRVLESTLDAVAAEFQTIGNEAILRIEKFELLLWLAAISVLLLVIGFIFYPMERSVQKTIELV